MQDPFNRFLGSKKHRAAAEEIKREVKQLPSNSITRQERQALRVSITELYKAEIKCVPGFSSSIESSLEEIWYPELATRREPQIVEKAKKESRDRVETDELKYDVGYALREREPDWYLALTDDFTNSIRKVDRKLQGRILDALGKLVKNPVSQIGDTVKPLTGDHRGFWRYRIGDYRLIYKPDTAKRYIYLLTFAARGSVYST